MSNYLYLVQPEEYLETNIYKIGGSKDLNQRMKIYGKKVIIYRTYTLIERFYGFETKLIELFNLKFNKFKGREYFEGNIDKMIETFDDLCTYFNKCEELKYKIFLKYTNNESEIIDIILNKIKTVNIQKKLTSLYKKYLSLFPNNIKFDEKWWLFGFNNCVYNMLEENFKNYEYDDYISI